MQIACFEGEFLKGDAAMPQSGGSVSAAEVEKYIGGIDFPASKDQLIDHARDKGAPKEVLELMQDFPDQQYGSAIDVSRGVGQVKH